MDGFAGSTATALMFDPEVGLKIKPQSDPPFVVLKTPPTVPAYKVEVDRGSIARLFTSRWAGSPLLMSLQLAPASALLKAVFPLKAG
jgi:hypothetical protein